MGADVGIQISMRCGALAVLVSSLGIFAMFAGLTASQGQVGNVRGKIRRREAGGAKNKMGERSQVARRRRGRASKRWEEESKSGGGRGEVTGSVVSGTVTPKTETPRIPSGGKTPLGEARATGDGSLRPPSAPLSQAMWTPPRVRGRPRRGVVLRPESCPSNSPTWGPMVRLLTSPVLPKQVRTTMLAIARSRAGAPLLCQG